MSKKRRKKLNAYMLNHLPTSIHPRVRELRRRRDLLLKK